MVYCFAVFFVVRARLIKVGSCWALGGIWWANFEMMIDVQVEWRKAARVHFQRWGRFPFGQLDRSGQMLIGLLETRDRNIQVLISYFHFKSQVSEVVIYFSDVGTQPSSFHHPNFFTQFLHPICADGKHYTQPVQLLRFITYTHHHMSIIHAHPHGCLLLEIPCMPPSLRPTWSQHLGVDEVLPLENLTQSAFRSLDWSLEDLTSNIWIEILLFIFPTWCWNLSYRLAHPVTPSELCWWYVSLKLLDYQVVSSGICWSRTPFDIVCFIIVVPEYAPSIV